MGANFLFDFLVPAYNYILNYKKKTDLNIHILIRFPTVTKKKRVFKKPFFLSSTKGVLFLHFQHFNSDGR